MARRASDLRPVADEVHAELLTWQRGVNIDEDSGQLNASLENSAHPDHIWRARARSFIFGTRVPYSVYHEAHRISQGEKSHMALPRHVLEDISIRIGRYIRTGQSL